MVFKVYKQLKRLVLFFIFVGSLLFTSCESKDKKMPDVNEVNNIYFDYKISGEEGYDNLTVILKYREENKNGDAFSPEVLKIVKLDDEELFPDSTTMNGVYYEVQRPIASFSGNHVITFITKNDKEYKEEINFSPMVLETVIPENISREDIVLDFSGLEIEDYIRVLLTDTSFFGDGINRIDTIRNNQLILSKNVLTKLADGPILMEFSREFERPINEASEAGGRLRINYTLRREFNLQK